MSSGHVRRADFYQIPSLYDILHTPGTAREVDGLERTALRFSHTSGARRADSMPRWLEPACGTGRYLRVAAGRGIDTLGFDRSEAMITYARRRADRVPTPGRQRYVRGEMTDFADRVGRGWFDFAFNLINTLRHLDDDAALLAHFAQVARVLRPGGVYAVGITLSRYGLEWPSEDQWEAARGRCRVQQIVQYIPPATQSQRRRRREQVLSHLFVTRPGGVEHVNSVYSLRTYSRRQWTRVIERSALRLVGVCDHLGNDAELGDGQYAVSILGVR